MSVRVSQSVWQRSKQSGERLLVLLALADWADDRGRAWPTLAMLMRKTRLTDRGVQKMLNDLIASGELVIERGGGRGRRNQYQITLADTPNAVRGLDAENPEQYSANERAKSGRASIHMIRQIYRGQNPERGSGFKSARSSRCKTPIPDDFSLTPERREMLASLHLDAEAFFAHFRDQATAQDYRYREWDAALRVWARKESRDPRSRFRVTPPARPRGRTFDEQLAARRAALANGEVR
jgi:hypothetical protein